MPATPMGRQSSSPSTPRAITVTSAFSNSPGSSSLRVRFAEQGSVLSGHNLLCVNIQSCFPHHLNQRLRLEGGYEPNDFARLQIGDTHSHPGKWMHPRL